MEELSKEVLQKIDELVDIIKSSEEYQKYREINKKLEKNAEIKEKIALVKKTQQELVKCEYYKDETKAKILEESLKRQKEELEEYPIYNEYQHIIEKMNQSLGQLRRLEESLQNITK